MNTNVFDMNRINKDIFRPGDYIIDDMGRKGTIKSLREDSYERTCREKDEKHGYYYHVEYEDGTFNTYVSGYFMKKDVRDIFV